MSINVVQQDDASFLVTINDSEYILTNVTASGDEVDSWLSTILRIHRRRLNCLVVGLDVEWRPNRYRNQQNPVAVLQLCVGRRCLVFQILHADYVPEALFDFLSDSRFSFVGVGIKKDVELLHDDHGLEAEDVYDLRDLAASETGRPEMRQMGLARLAAEVMGVQVAKSNWARMSRWDQRWLSADQIGYATVDAFLSFEIGRRLFAGEF